MKLTTLWREKMQFTGETGGHTVPMDAKPPIGAGSAMTPKELLLAGACGCTGMDVVALLRKHKQPLAALSIEADATTSEGGHPAVFDELTLTFRFEGELDPARAVEAVRLSQTQYCGVSAMLAKAFPIHYQVFVNGRLAGAGRADFTTAQSAARAATG